MADKVQNSNTFYYTGEMKKASSSFLGTKDGEITIHLKRPNSNETETYKANYKFGEKPEDSLAYKTGELLDILNKYSTEDSPEINQKELWEAYNDLYKNNSSVLEETVKVSSANSYSETTPAGKVIENFERAAQHFSDPNSPDGENINPDELYDMAEMLLGWGGYTKEEEKEK